MTMPNDPTRAPQETASTVGLTMRDLLMEVRTNVYSLKDELAQLRTQVVMRSEYEKDLKAASTARKYFVTTILSVVAVATSVLVAVVNLYPLP